MTKIQNLSTHQWEGGAQHRGIAGDGGEPQMKDLIEVVSFDSCETEFRCSPDASGKEAGETHTVERGGKVKGLEGCGLEGTGSIRYAAYCGGRFLDAKRERNGAAKDDGGSWRRRSSGRGWTRSRNLHVGRPRFVKKFDLLGYRYTRNGKCKTWTEKTQTGCELVARGGTCVPQQCNQLEENIRKVEEPFFYCVASNGGVNRQR